MADVHTAALPMMYEGSAIDMQGVSWAPLFVCNHFDKFLCVGNVSFSSLITFHLAQLSNRGVYGLNKALADCRECRGKAKRGRGMAGEAEAWPEDVVQSKGPTM